MSNYDVKFDVCFIYFLRVSHYHDSRYFQQFVLFSRSSLFLSIMESGKRSKNFTEREKMLLIEIAKEFVSVFDNKKTDGTSVEAKKQAWIDLTNKYNAISETGMRTEKQLHALYDNLKKKARKNMSDDKVGT